jgi:hypothetical protein
MVTMVDHGNFSVENPQITILIFFCESSFEKLR